MARGKVVLEARPVGASRVLHDFIAATGALRGDTLEAQRELGQRSEVIFAAHAPHRTGRLIRGIASVTLGGKVIVKDEARNPTSGYDYVGVTRFGHRAARIYPTHRFSAFTLATKRRRHGETLTHGYDSFASGHAALRFVIGGRVLYRTSVAGYHPASDWAEDALPEVSSAAQGVATRLGRRIEARF